MKLCRITHFKSHVTTVDVLDFLSSNYSNSFFSFFHSDAGKSTNYILQMIGSRLLQGNSPAKQKIYKLVLK